MIIVTSDTNHVRRRSVHVVNKYTIFIANGDYMCSTLIYVVFRDDCLRNCSL